MMLVGSASPRNHQARGGRRSAGQQIDRCQCARDQDADRLLQDVEKKAGVAPPPEPALFTAADEEVMATFITRLRQSWEEELQQKGTEPGFCSNDDEHR